MQGIAQHEHRRQRHCPGGKRGLATDPHEQQRRREEERLHQRQPAIALLQRHCEVVELVSDTDYRLRALTQSPVGEDRGCATGVSIKGMRCSVGFSKWPPRPRR